MGLLAALGLAPRRAMVADAGVLGTVVASDGPRRAPPIRVADVDASPDPAPDHGFSDASKPVQQGLDELKRHPQQARVKDRIDEIASLLAQARGEALKGRTQEASALLQQASDKLGPARNLANYFIEYVRARTKLDAMGQGLRNDDPAFEQAVAAELVRVDGIAYAKPPKPLDAIAELNATIKKFKPVLQARIDDVKQARAALQAKKMPLRTYAEADLKQIDKLIAQMDQAAASGTWGLAMMARERALDILAPTAHMMERREAFESERRKAGDTVASVRAVPGMAARAAALEALLRQADRLATPKEMGFDEAMRLVQRAGERGQAWLSISAWVAGYDKLRADGLRDAAALAKDPAARPYAPRLAAIDKLLADAAAAAAAAEAGGDLVAGFRKGLDSATRASVELARVRQMVQGLGPVMQARALARDASDLAGLKSSLAALRAEADKAAKAPFAAEAAPELRQATVAAGQADTALDRSDGKAALARIADMAQHLAATRRLQVQRGLFEAELARVERHRKALDRLATLPLLKARLALVDTGLADAKAKSRQPDGAAALAALQRADDAASAVEQADADRRRFDAEAGTVDGLVKAVTDAKLRAEMGQRFKAADAQAAAYSFDAAIKALAAIKVRIDEATVRSLAASKPDDPALAAAAERIMKNGGAAALDRLIEDFPAKGSLNAATAIAKARHGLEFTFDAWSPHAGEIQALKTISKVLAQVPQDARSSPSIRRVTHTDAQSGENEYEPRTATIDLTGLPGSKDKQRFGADLKVDGSNRPQLPKDIPREYQPQDTKPVERLNWATLHEVGHGLDDKHRFMSRHEEDPKFGNWKTYGTDVKPIADAVGTMYAFNTTAEQKQYVLDLILNTPSEPPPEPKSPPSVGLSWEDLRKEVVNWRERAGRRRVYEDQGACDNLTIGDTIYHEAYPRTWVSYPASERKKGLTGYQFRAPGEWFAELYAGYRSGRLGPRHPALDWLKKIAP